MRQGLCSLTVVFVVCSAGLSIASTCPSPIGSTVPGDFSGGIAVVGSYAYLTDFNDGIHIFDVSDPTAPFEVGAELSGGNSFGVAVSGSFAIVGSMGSVRVYNVADPASPTISGQLILGGAVTWGCAESGMILKLGIIGNHAYVPGTCGLHILDTSSLPWVETVSVFDTPGRGRDVEVVDGLAYVADGSGGLRIINVANPAVPFEVGHVSIPGEVYGIAVSGNRAYLGVDPGGLMVIDITNPSAPAMMGVFAGSCTDVVATDQFAAGRMGESTFSRVINVVDITDSWFPSLLGSSGFSQCTSLAIQGDYLYAVGIGGLKVLDISGCRGLVFVDDLLPV